MPQARPTPALMIQGTGSNVGKSVITAGLARLFSRRGLQVRPFKPQNMSNNAAVTADGGEIGRAQAVQAQAAGVAPSVHMNPVLLKPQSETGSQIIVQGEVWATLDARGYTARKAELMAPVLESFERLSQDADLILVEGAGSPAEVNLRTDDIANMGFARAANVSVVLCADIDRGGVIASLVGTHQVISEDDRAMVRGYFINRFRGDVSLFDDGLTAIDQHTGWPSFGVIPWFEGARDLPAEDVLGLASGAGSGAIIAVPRFRRIANFEDLDPLRMEPEVDLRFIEPGDPLPARADAVILPGSKTTIPDLKAMRANGWDKDLAELRERGALIVGLCGGYQMLGTTVSDPDGLEGPAGTAEALGLLGVETALERDKTVRFSAGVERKSGAAVSGYEIHLGRTHGPDTQTAMLQLDGGRVDGAVSPDGLVMGCYLHGLFASDAFRARFLERLGVRSRVRYQERVDAALDGLADHLETCLDIEGLLTVANSRHGRA